MTEENLSYEFNFEQNSKEIKIVMTAGLLNKLMQSVGGIRNLDEFMLNPETQENFLKILLQDYDDKGNVKGMKCSLFEIAPSISTELLVWGFDHCANFIQQTATKMKNISDRVMEKLTAEASQATKAG